MSGSKVLLFGTFTEDETRSWMSHSPAGVENFSEKRDIQFGSLDLVSGKSLGGSSDESGQKIGSLGESTGVHAPHFLSGDEEVKAIEITTGLFSGAPRSTKENGVIHNSKHFSPLTNGLKELKTNNGFGNLSLSQEDSTSYGLSSLNLHELGNGRLKGRVSNGSAQSSSAIAPSNQNTLNTSDAAVMSAKAPHYLLRRGLINSGNMCFLNATLQALLSCSPFFHLLLDLRNRNLPKVKFPTLTAFAEFVSDFEVISCSNLKKKDVHAFETGRPLFPAMFETVLKNFTPDVPNNISGRPRQEDAQEFLSFIMDQMHDELLKHNGQFSSTNKVKTSMVSYAEDDGWETVGPKNKSAVTRTQTFIASELSAIFGGQLRSIVKASGNIPSVTVQPYLLLHLDIFPEAVRTVEDALRLFSAPEMLEGYRAPTAGKAGPVAASKSIKIQTLSKIMILHLMRFSFGSQGSTKLHKPVRFSLDLMLGRELLFSPSTEGRKYELVATITHHGKEPSKGHYTCDAFHNGRWLRFDDGSVTGIGTNKVLHDQAYVLFYKQI